MADRTVKPRLPRGLIDRPAGDVAATDRMLAAIRESYELYGFEAVETPFIEYTDALGKFLPDQDRPNEGVFSFQDDDEQWLSLRYDLTAPLARYVAENFDRLAKPYRSYRCGWVFRNEKPGPGRFRQFMQFDADTVGSASPAADAEICMMAADTLERLGVKRGDYVIKVNNRKVLDGVMELAGVREDQKLAVLRSIDKADKFPREDIRKLLQSGRWDGGEIGKGDFTKGAGLDNHQADRVLEFLYFRDGKNFISPDEGAVEDDSYEMLTYEQLMDRFPGRMNTSVVLSLALWFRRNKESGQGVKELEIIARLVDDAGYNDRIRIDPSVVRGLEYYTGPVFEAELTFEVTGDDGRPVRFGSVGGGGRYDGLVGRFRGESVPATGFSIGVSRLFAALKAVKSPIVEGAAARGPVVVLVLDRDQLPAYQRLVSTLRAAGIAAEMYLGEAGMNAQLKYADRRGSVCAVIQGSNERDKGEVAIKDLVAGADLAKNAKTLERDAYLALKERAQVNVAVSLLVETVRGILARH